MSDLSINSFQQKNIISETISAILVSKNYKEASELLEIDRTTLYKRLKNHPEIGEIASYVQEYAQNALKLASARAVNILIKGMDSGFMPMRINCAKEILDRIGIHKNNSMVDSGGISKDNEPLSIVITDYKKNSVEGQ